MLDPPEEELPFEHVGEKHKVRLCTVSNVGLNVRLASSS